MFAIERRRQLLRLLEEKGSLDAGELACSLKVSAMTLWRDLLELERKGLLRRVRGGAVPNDAREPSFSEKEERHRRAKRAIGGYAAGLLCERGQVLAVEGGTTATAFIEQVEARSLTVLTNALSILHSAGRRNLDWTVLGSGGLLRSPSLTFVGPEAEAFFAAHHAHLAIVSATGLCVAGGLTDVNPLEIAVKRSMIAQASRLIVLLDSSKFGVRAPCAAASLAEIDVLICDKRPEEELCRALEAEGVELRVAREARANPSLRPS